MPTESNLDKIIHLQFLNSTESNHRINENTINQSSPDFKFKPNKDEKTTTPFLPHFKPANVCPEFQLSGRV